MPVRIYALAKELKADSKQLVDICTKAGVTGKGSALASLSDEEVAKIKAYLTGGKKGSAKAVTGQKAATTVATSAAITRDDYISPGHAESKIKVIAPQAKKAAADKQGSPAQGKEARQGESGAAAATKAPVKKEPVVKLAAVPEVKQPPEKPPATEPAPQKPIMTLPKDAIRGAKSGKTAPLEQFTRQHEKKRKAEESRKKKATATEQAGRIPAKAPPAKTGPRHGRRGKAVIADREDVNREKGLAGMAGTRQARQTQRKRRSSARVVVPRADEARVRRRVPRLKRKGTNTAAPRKGKIVIELPCSLRVFSERTGTPTAQIQRTLMQLGTLATITAQLDTELAEVLVDELGLDVELKQTTSLEEAVLARIRQTEDAPETLQPRPPVVTFLGHVDHGKTSLLDRIIGVNVVEGEAGGITQHIRAYVVEKSGREISFVDTPGHEAFTEMRARGANVTDIAVLVIAADDGIMPQTEEAISHIKAAGVPIVVALNKIDLPGVDADRVLQQLSAAELLPSQWGGDVEVVRTSAVTGEGIDALLETLFLTADLHEFRANPERQALGVCLEANQEAGRGVMCKVIVQNGTLHVGDILVCGGAYGRVKAMYHTLQTRRKVQEARPSIPVNLAGLNIAPEAGDAFYVLDDLAQAREIADNRRLQRRRESLSGKTTRVSFEEFQQRLAEGRLGDGEEGDAVLNLIVRADVRGSIEAIQKEFGKLAHPEVRIDILQATVGGITVGDVTLADASNAVIVGFNVIPDEMARSLADERGVEIRRYDVIYKVTEDIRAMLEGKLKPEERIVELGRALVQQIFTISRVGTVAGCRVLAGTIERGCRVRVNRDGRGIGDYVLESLRREKEDVKEAREGFECGMKLVGFNDLKEGDVLEAYKLEERPRTLEEASRG